MRSSLTLPAWTAACCLVYGCSGEHAPSAVEAPGAPPTARTSALAAGAELMQRRDPVRALDVYLDGFHFFNGNARAQVEAHHYCSVVNEDVKQCVIYDGNGRDAKLMGVEYVVSRRVFERLPEQERRLWHSHVYEVKSGTLVAPGIPEPAEHELMEQLVGTYGKTWHTWHTDHDHELPLGPPVLMVGFTDDGQLDPSLVARRDERLELSTSQRREAREDIATPTVAEGADAWQRGETLQLMLHPVTAPTNFEPAQSRAPDHTQVESTTEPTRPLRATRGRQLYAAMPGLVRD